MTTFIDYFFSVGPNNDQVPSNTLVNTRTSTAILVSGYGGYTGLAGDVVQTSNLETIQSFQNFNISTIATDWQSFLSYPTTLLKSNSPKLLGLTISGVSYTSNQTNNNYGIYTFSGSNGSSYVQTTIGGGNNLLTSNEADFVAGSWSGSSVTSGTNVTISGLTLVYIPLISNVSYGASYGDFPYGTSPYEGADLEGVNVAEYDYLVTASGNGTVTQAIIYNSTISGGVPQTFTQITSISGISNLNFLTSQPVNTNIISVQLTTSGEITYSQAGLFRGYTNSWVSPLLTNSMRISTVARLFLPDTSKGTYTLSLYSNSNVLLAENIFAGLPTQTWIDLTVDYILPPQINNQSFYSILFQNYSTEKYQLSMFGLFYNPISYQFSIDNATWYPITIGINDAFTSINTGEPTQNLYIKAILLEDNATINALQIAPQFTQTPFYNSTNINFLSDPKINGSMERTPTYLLPLFQPISLDFPFIYSQQRLMNIQNPFLI
jgi:hypothetical protein